MGLARVILPLLLLSFGGEERTFFDCLTKVKNILRNRGKSRVNQKRRKKVEVEVEAQVSDDGLPCDRPSKSDFFGVVRIKRHFAQSNPLNLLQKQTRFKETGAIFIGLPQLRLRVLLYCYSTYYTCSHKQYQAHLRKV